MASSQDISRKQEKEDDQQASSDALAAALKATLTTKPSDLDSIPVLPQKSSKSPGAFSQFFSHPFAVTWRSALVKAPRLVPLQVLKYTVPEGPWPIKWELTSPRGDNKITSFIWVPPPDVLEQNGLLKDGEDKLQLRLPVLVDFHGGGFVIGSCLEQGPFCAQMSRELCAVVISVDYRMGPISKFPTAIWDAEDVLAAVVHGDTPGGKSLRECVARRLIEGLEEQLKGEKNDKKRETWKSSPPRIDPEVVLDETKIAISGFSSGGNLALNLGLDIKPPDLPERWPSVFPPDHPSSIPLILFYPSFDSRLLPSQRERPANLPPTSPFWSDVSDIIVPTYLPRHQAGHPRASPGLADVKASLHPKAKVLLVLPEIDTLAAQGDTWMKRVEEAGRQADVEVVKYPEMKHGWTQYPVSWLNEEEKRDRADSYDRTREFVLQAWGKKKSPDTN